MQFTYCSRWFRAKAAPIDPLSEDDARIKHDSRSPYVAALGDPVTVFLEFAGDYLGVGFLDEYGREYLMYQYQEFEPNRLFLTMAVHREFQSENSQVVGSTVYYFKPTGELHIEKVDDATHVVTTQDSMTDVSGNWELYPVFGDYQGLLNKERD